MLGQQGGRGRGGAPERDRLRGLPGPGNTPTGELEQVARGAERGHVPLSRDSLGGRVSMPRPLRSQRWVPGRPCLCQGEAAPDFCFSETPPRRACLPALPLICLPERCHLCWPPKPLSSASQAFSEAREWLLPGTMRELHFGQRPAGSLSLRRLGSPVPMGAWAAPMDAPAAHPLLILTL